MGNERSENRQPLVSVVTPTYNQAAFLRETIESVLSQDYPHIEHIVIDDGSTDETPQILAEYSGRIQWESQTNMGQTPTINKGWAQSKGDIITWLNSDDTFLPSAVSKGVEYLNSHPDVGIVFGDTLFTEGDGTPIEESKRLKGFDFKKFVVKCENLIPQPSAFIRRSVLENTGPLDPSYYYFMDWDFWLRAGIRNRIDYFPELLSTYRLHQESKTVAQAAKAAPELEYMYRKFFALPELPDEIKGLEKWAMVNMYFTSGGYYLKGGNPKAARQVGFKALQSNPMSLSRPQMVHKFLYCLLGGGSSYQRGRGMYHKARAALGDT